MRKNSVLQEYLFKYKVEKEQGQKQPLQKSAGWTETESSVQFSRSDVSDSLRPHESQHARPSGPSPTSRGEPQSPTHAGSKTGPGGTSALWAERLQAFKGPRWRT